MKNYPRYITIFLLLFSGLAIEVQAQKNTSPLNLRNALVVSLQDNLSDQYSMEIALITLFKKYGIHSKASLNMIKQEGTKEILLSDSLQTKLKEEGIDTYVLVSVRGFDKRFKPSESINSLEEEITAGHLYPLYRDGISRVTFSFIFYTNGEPVYQELIRTGSVGSKEAVIKKMIKKVEKRLSKHWL